MPTLAPSPKLPRYGYSRASAYLPKAYVSSKARKDIDKLWSKFKGKGCDASRDELIQIYLPLVRVTAERMHGKLPSHVEVDELIQAGVFGLMDAVDGFARPCSTIARVTRKPPRP